MKKQLEVIMLASDNKTSLYQCKESKTLILVNPKEPNNIL